MKKHIILFAMSALFTVSAFAQERPERGGNPEERAEKMAARVSEKLSLTEETSHKLAAVYTESFEEMKASRAEAREKMKAIGESQNEKIKQLLTEEEYEAYAKMEQEHRDRDGRRGKGKGHRRPATNR